MVRLLDREYFAGLEIDRVVNFLDEQGLYARSGTSIRRPPDRISGSLWHDKIAFLERDKEFEKVNGTIYSEGILVHELAHLTKGNPLSVDFGHNGKGQFLEEGFVEMLRGAYVSRYAPQSLWQKMVEAIGFGDTTGEFIPYDIFIKENIRVPFKYLFLNNKGKKLQVYSQAYAGAAVELLCRRIDGLEGALREARMDAPGLERLNHLLEQEKIGLAAYLMAETTYAENGGAEDFAQRADYIFEVFS